MSFTAAEISTQPDCWRQAGALVRHVSGLPIRGERVAAVGCGSSLHVAQAYAALRVTAGAGETDAFTPSEFRFRRRYDRIVAVTRSGTTSEVLELLKRLSGTVPITVLVAAPNTPVLELADHGVVLEFADERSVVQTRSATTALAVLRAHATGCDLEQLADEAAAALALPLPPRALEARQFTFLGSDWAYAVACEAALKLRESAQAWTESYYATEYRHGPISVTTSCSMVWIFGESPAGLVEQVEPIGSLVRSEPAIDPMVELILAQRLAVELARADGLDPDRPRNLPRSVVLPATAAK